MGGGGGGGGEGVGLCRLTRECIFSYLCLYEIGFCPCEKLLSHDHCSPPFNLLVQGTIHLKVGEKESIMSQSMQDMEISTSSLVEIPTPRVRFPYPAWTLIMDYYSFSLKFVSVSIITRLAPVVLFYIYFSLSLYYFFYHDPL